MLPVGNFLKRSRYDDKTGEPDISHLTRQHETPPILLLLHDHRGIGGCLALPRHSEHPLRLAAQGRHLLRLVPQGGWVPDPEIGAAMAALNPVLRFLSHPSMELVIKFQLRFASGQRGCRTRTGTRPALSSPGSGARSKVIARSQGDQIHHTKNVRSSCRLRSVGQRQRHDELV